MCVRESVGVLTVHVNSNLLIFLGCICNTVCMFVLLCIYTYVLSLIKYKCKKNT